MIKTVIFDLDGTLLDTIADLGASINEALVSRGFTKLSDSIFPSLVGYGARNLCERAYYLSVGMKYDKESIEAGIEPDHHGLISEILKDFRENYRKNINVKTKPYNGVSEMIEQMKIRDIKLNVLSNKPDHFTKMLVMHHFGKGVFSEIMGESDRFPRKPDPSAALYILGSNGSDPGESVLIGDGDSDIMTARAAGMNSIAVLWGYRGFQELKEAGAESFASYPGDILELLKTDFNV